MDSKEINIAMEIILLAGNARNAAMDAINFQMSGDQNSANKSLKDAHRYIKEAHIVQTQAIQNEARGEKLNICLLFIHAQDTLMTIASEINLIKLMINMYINLEEKLYENSK